MPDGGTKSGQVAEFGADLPFTPLSKAWGGSAPGVAEGKEEDLNVDSPFGV